MRDRQAVQRTGLRAVGERLVGQAGGLDRALGGQRHDRVHGRVHGLDALEMGGEHLAGREVADPYAPRELGRRQEAELARTRSRPAGYCGRSERAGASPARSCDAR